MHPKIKEIKERQLKEHADAAIVGLTEHFANHPDNKHLFVTVAIFDNRLGQGEFRSTLSEEDTVSLYKAYINRITL